MLIQKAVKLYDLNNKNTKVFNNKSGIYALIYDNEVIYIGQSINLKDRLNRHGRKSKVNETIKKIEKEEGKVNRSKQLAMYLFIDKHRENIQFAILKETNDLNKYEKHYIELFTPKFNYKGVDVPY